MFEAVRIALRHDSCDAAPVDAAPGALPTRENRAQFCVYALSVCRGYSFQAMVHSVFSLARLDEARQCWVVESDESCVIYVHAGLPGRTVVPTSGNMSIEEGENIAPERATPAWWRVRLRYR